MLVRLSVEEKVLGIGALLVLIGAFMPWYSMSLTVSENSLTESGFSGDMGVIGFIVVLLSAMSLAFLIAEHLHIKLPNFGYKKNQIILFLTGESAFLILLTIAIYTKRSLLYTNAELRFGIYLALIGACMGAFASFAQIQRTQKKDVEAFFDHSEEEIEETAEISNDAVGTRHALSNDEDIKYAVGTRRNLSNDEISVKKYEPAKSTNEQKGFFYDEPEEEVIENEEAIEDIDDDLVEDFIADTDEDPVEEVIEDPAEEVITAESSSSTDSKPAANDAVGDADLRPNDEIIEEQPIKSEEDIDLKIDKEESSSQGNYFMRDAGVEEKKSDIKVDIDSIKPVEKSDDTAKTTVDAVETRQGASQGDETIEKTPHKKEAEVPKMSFYDDL